MQIFTEQRAERRDFLKFRWHHLTVNQHKLLEVTFHIMISVSFLAKQGYRYALEC